MSVPGLPGLSERQPRRRPSPTFTMPSTKYIAARDDLLRDADVREVEVAI